MDVVKTFNWCIRDVNSWVSLREYTIDSPQYTMGNRQCRFYLQLSYYEKQLLSVLLCRQSNDGGPALVETRFFLELRTVSRCVLSTPEFRFSFARGGSEGMTIFNTENDLVDILRNELESDVLIVACTSVLLEPPFVFLSEGVEHLSYDLWKLRNETRFNNAHFVVAGGERVPVCKEILCSRSPVIREMLQNGDDLVEERFQAEVVKAMIDYCYCSRVSLRELDCPSLRQLLFCAQHYRISDLEQLLTPKYDEVTSSLNSWTESHKLQFPNFTKLCNRSDSVEHRQITMEFDENIAMTARLLFRDYIRNGRIALEVTFENLTDVKSVFVRLSILDNFSNPSSTEEVRLEVHGRELQFSLEFETSELFSGFPSSESPILPANILTLQFELKFLYPGIFHISDPHPWNVTDALRKNEPSLALISSMRSLLESEMNSDVTLRTLPTPSREMSVHRSVLSVRSPVFEDVFKKSREISVDLDESSAKEFLHYLYTGVLLSDRLRTLSVLHRVAGECRIDPLKRACEETVAKITLNTRNVFSVYLFAIRADWPDLRNSCKDFILKNKDLILCGRRLRRLRESNEPAWNEIRQYISTG